MAVQKKRRSISRRRAGWSHTHVKMHEIVKCDCGSFRRSHRACSECGIYKGVKII